MNKMKAMMGTLAGVSALVLAFCVGATTPTGDDVKFVSGTIYRVDADQWAAMDNSGHTPTGIESVQLLPDRIRVHYTFTADKVSSVQVTSDNGFAASDVHVGTSVGFSYMDIFFYMGSSTTPVNPALLSKPGANVWISGVFDLEPVGVPQ